MITFSAYRKFLTELSAQGIHARRVDSIESARADHRLLVLKHDVEAALPLALKLARIEAHCGHAATYYFQGDLLHEDCAASILREIVSLGHEVGYHYDVLDACNGDYAAAIIEFERYKSLLEELSGYELRTVCPHGNPTKVRSGWRSNKDFFRCQEVRRHYPSLIDIVIDFAELLPGGTYLSDAGFTLRRIGDIGGNDTSNEAAIADGSTISWPEITPLVKADQGVLLSIHPHRLRDNAASLWVLRKRMSVLRAGYRMTARVPLVRTVASKFYAIARRL